MDFTNLQGIFSEWGWLIAAAVLIALEILAPGVFFLFFAFAAFIVAGVAFIVDIGWQFEVLLFAIIGFLSMYAGRKYFKSEQAVHEDNPINNPMMAFIGDVVILHTAIENGTGKARIKDSVWTVLGADAAEGSKVKITGTNGQKFTVEPV
ncbi:MAG: NfeD family protein [Hyphomicrobiales bacterium]